MGEPRLAGYARRIAIATVIPLAACGLQLLLWSTIRPFVWFFFYPAVFFASGLSGAAGGLWATALSTVLVVYCFVPPQMSFAVESPENLASVAIFIGMGVVFTVTHDRLRRANESVARALAESNDANRRLEEANRRAEELYRRTLELDTIKTQFFANVSHELRTPLALILGPLQSRLARRDTTDADRQELAVVVRNANILRRHVDDLLDIAKLEAGGMPPSYAPADLARLVRAVASQFTFAASEAGIGLEVQTPDSLPGTIDSEKYRRIVVNLISNALKFTPTGGAVTVRLTSSARLAALEVADTGPGVPAPLRKAVFERFRQVDGGITRRHGGTGLGLAIVKEFAELHHGSVVLGEAPGGGASFVVAVPLDAPEGAHIGDAEPTEAWTDDIDAASLLNAAAGPTGTDASGTEGGGPLVLVVEDNADMRSYVASVLRRRFRVATAADGREGLEKAVALSPALVVSDLMMPGMSGADLVTAIREHRDIGDVPVIVLTAKADDGLRPELFHRGVQDYLVKPFSPAELLARAERCVGDRLRSTHQLRASEERFRLEHSVFEAVIEHMPLGVVLASPDGTLLLMNTAALQMHDFDSQAGMHHHLKQFVEDWVLSEPGGRRLPVEEWPLARAVGGDYPRGIEVELEHRRTGRRWRCVYDGAPVLDDNGDVSLLVLILQDLTDRRRAEAAQALLEAQFRQAQKMEAVGQLAGGVAHDFNNLLQIIMGSSSIAGIELPPDHSVQDLVGEITNAGARAATLVGQLLAFSRRQILKPDRVDLNELVGRFITMIRRVIGEHIALDFHPGVPCAVTADPGMLEQVLMNLCVNARDAIGSAGAITIETGVATVDETECADSPWASPGPYAVVTVTDNGCGMDAATAAHVFEPFFTTKGPGKGSGLGLATVYGIITQHKGIVRVASEVGQGTTFTVLLPQTTTEARADECSTAAPLVSGGETILLAEDEAGVRRLVARVLRKAGYTVVEAESGEAALARFKEHEGRFDMLLLDVVMPGMGGRAVFDRIREEFPRIPALFASGYSGDAVHTDFVLSAGMHLIQKPFLLRRPPSPGAGGARRPRERLTMAPPPASQTRPAGDGAASALYFVPTGPAETFSTVSVLAFVKVAVSLMSSDEAPTFTV